MSKKQEASILFRALICNYECFCVSHEKGPKGSDHKDVKSFKIGKLGR